MYTLSIEHRIVDFETWQAAFDRDPVGRARSGLRRHRVFQLQGDPKYVVIELDFASVSEAEAFRTALEGVWGRAELSPGLPREPGVVAVKPQTRILREMATQIY